MTGAVASWLCAVHCLALPFIFTLLPIAGLSFLLDETTELAFIGLSILIAAASLLPGYFRHHGRIRTLILFVSGIGLIVLSHLFFEEDLLFKVVFLLTGAASITASHFINRRLCKSCIVCRDEHPAES